MLKIIEDGTDNHLYTVGATLELAIRTATRWVDSASRYRSCRIVKDGKTVARVSVGRVTYFAEEI